MPASALVGPEVQSCVVAVDDPDRADVRRLVQVHRERSLEQTPPEGRLCGIGGLKQLDPSHGEIKTMHVAGEARGRGMGRMLLTALVDEARRRGYRRLSLETGTGDSFRPARALYESFGFRAGPAFGGYANTEHNLCMTLVLPADPPEDAG